MAGSEAEEAAVGPTPLLNLKEVARLLDVHYMTVYRYVRHGRLPARRHGPIWVVDRADVDAFRDGPEHPGAAQPPGGPAAGARSAPGGVDWVARLAAPLRAGDEVAAWTVVLGALSAGHDVASVHLDLIAGAVARIGASVGHGQASTVDERLAVATATRLVARLGGRFPRRGRKRGTVVLAAPPGEYHGLPLALVANLIRHAGFAVLELGIDTPAADVLVAVDRADDLIAVGLGVTTIDRLDAACSVIAAVRLVHPSLPVLLGGQAVRNREVAELAGAVAWSAGPDLVDALDALARARRADRPQPTAR